MTQPAAAPPNRLAAIDIGSNTIRLVVAEAMSGGRFRVIDDERESPRLARRLSTTGRLDPQAVSKTIDGLRRFKQLADGLGVVNLQTIATSAVREAENGEEFIRRIAAETGLVARTITAEEEGLYALRSVQHAFDLSDQNIAVVDIGGGSTEVVFASAGHVEEICSTRLGAVRLMELYGDRQSLFGEDYDRLIREIDRELKRTLKKPLFSPQMLYGTGGTFTALASMIIAARKEDSQLLWGYRVTRANVRHLLERLSNMSLKERRGLPGLNADRADIILTGLAILDRVMARLKTNVLRVHTGGVRDGLLLSMLEQLPSHRRPAIDRREAIEQFALSCGADLDHARHVARLSGQLYDELVRCVDLEPGDKEVLQAAALLQDCGYLISYKQHHRHSFQLIVNSQLAGFRRHDLELIANVARYHRGARPKQKHANFRKLNKADQRRVRRLAAILRIAGGLDRGHTQNVQRLSVRATTGHIVIHVSARHDPDLELWAARSRSDLFERVFRRGVSIHAMPRPEEEYAGVPQPAAAGVPGQALVNIGSAQET